MGADRAVPAVGRDQKAKTSPPLFRGEVPLGITWRHTLAIRLQPDLQEMHRLFGGGVVLAVLNAGSSTHALHVTRANQRFVPMLSRCTKAPDST